MCKSICTLYTSTSFVWYIMRSTSYSPAVPASAGRHIPEYPLSIGSIIGNSFAVLLFIDINVCVHDVISFLWNLRGISYFVRRILQQQTPLSKDGCCLLFVGLGAGCFFFLLLFFSHLYFSAPTKTNFFLFSFFVFPRSCLSNSHSLNTSTTYVCMYVLVQQQ